MGTYSIRCTNCGKRLAEGTRICPACGVEQPLHVNRIRCGYCSRRVPSNVVLCPYCKHNPRHLYLRPRFFIGLLGLIGAIVLIYGAFNAPRLFGGLALPKLPAPTVAVAAEPPLLVVTATSVPSATFTPVPTLAPTLFVPTTSLTAVPSVRPSATPTATRSTVKVLPPTPMPTPTPILLAPPSLLGPKNGEKIYGAKRIILLTFQPVELQASEWYRVQVDLHDRDNRAASWCGWSQETTVRFPAEYYDDSWQLDRTFRWHVNVAVSDANPPSTCAAATISMGAASEDRVFYWQ